MPLGSPHNHSYKSIESDFTVNVFCTPKHKTYHFDYDKVSDIRGCSKLFLKDSCISFQNDIFFEQEKFLHTIRMNDRKFHDVFEIDTLILSISETNTFIKLLPHK
jgi:hypothetical protein